MRTINLTNDKKRDAEVGLEGGVKKSSVCLVLPDGAPRRNVKFLKSSSNTAALLAKHGSLLDAGRALLNNDA